ACTTLWCFGKALARIAPRLAALPAGGIVGRGKRLDAIEPADRLAEPAAFRLQHLDAVFRQFIEEAARHRRVPQSVNAAMRGEIDLGALPRPRQADMGKPPLLLEPGAALVVQRTLMRQQPFLPARQKHRVELK